MGCGRTKRQSIERAEEALPHELGSDPDHTEQIMVKASLRLSRLSLRRLRLDGHD
jgi:hypothetical protein